MLTLKNRLFVDEYIRCGFNASEACRRVYTNIKSPAAYGGHMLERSEVKQYLEAKLKPIDITAEEIIADIRELAKNGKTEANRIRCYELLARIKGLLTDKPQVQVAIFSDIMKEIPKAIDI